jgi:hypothetical protein
MKAITFLFMSFFLLHPLYSQSKKDLEQRIIILEEEKSQLEKIVAGHLITIGNLETESKSLITKQHKIVDSLQKQIDSLLIQTSKNDRFWGFVTKPRTEEDSIFFLIQSYFNCNKWEERIKLVSNPDYVMEHIDSFKSKYVAKNIRGERIIIQDSRFLVNQPFKVQVTGEGFVYCIKTTDGFKVDWAATKGFNPISLNMFYFEKETKPTDFRVHARIAPSGTYKSDIEELYLVVAISIKDPYFMDYCVIPKESDLSRSLYAILQDGDEHQLILKLRFADYQTNLNTYNSAIISGVVDSWSMGK